VKIAEKLDLQRTTQLYYLPDDRIMSKSEKQGEQDETGLEEASFEKLSLSPQLVSNLINKELRVPTRVQRKVIPKILDERGKDFCVNAPTGSGKTLAYALPITEVGRLPLALILDFVKTTVHSVRMSCHGAYERIGSTGTRSIRLVCQEDASQGTISCHEI
jgi:superfamily II DNA or RNA helicase